MKIKRVIVILLIVCFSISLLGCGNGKTTNNSLEDKASEEDIFNQKLKDSVNAIAKSEEAVNIEKFAEVFKDDLVYSFEFQDLIDNNKTKKVVLSTTLDDIAKINNEYYLYFAYYLNYSTLLFKLKCTKEQLDKFVQDKKKYKPKDNMGYVIVGEISRSFKSKLNLSSDVTENDPEYPISEVVIEFQNILIIEGELVKAISYESIK